MRPGVMGALWETTLFQTHMTCRILFEDGVLSEPSRVLEGSPFQGVKGSLAFEAPGYPAVLVVGHTGLEYLDCMYPGRAKESAGEDPFGRPCVEVFAANANAIDGISEVTFVAPAFTTAPDFIEALAKRRIS